MKSHLLFFIAAAMCIFFTSGCGKTGGDTGLPLEQKEIIEDEADPECSYFYFLWGRYAEVSGLLDEALEAYEKALICDPDNVWIEKKLPLILLRLNRVEEAGKRLHSYLMNHPDDTAAQIILAKVFIHQELYDKAIEQYSYIYKQQPHDPRSLLLISELYLSLQRFDEARKTLLQFISISDAPYPGHVLLARLFAYKNQFEQAVEQYKTALKINWSPGLELELGELYLQKNKYAEAEKIYKRLLAKDKTDEKAAMSLINVYLLQEKFQQAHEELTRLQGVSTNLEQLEFSLAVIYTRQKQFNKAIDTLTRLLDREDSSRARYLLGITFARENKHEEALIQLEQISLEAEEYEDAVLLQVRILNLLHRPEEGMFILDEALSAGGEQFTELFLLLANMHELQGDNQAGEDTFKRAMYVHPANYTLFYEFGLFLGRQEEIIRAVAMMQKVIYLNPYHAGALNFVGYTWADRNENLEQALEYIKRAVLLKPENGYIRDSLGWVYYRLGYLNKARNELEKALQLSPDEPEILEHLAEVYIGLGLQKKGIAAYKKAVQFYDDEVDKQRVLEKIRIAKEGDDS